MDEIERGQLNASAAEVYERFFVPALFSEWVEPVLDAAGVGPGDRVLDVACGTGVLARGAQRRVGASGETTGLDRNEGMLAVARSRAPDIAWRSGLAEALPFADGAFDAVVSQFGLMFFDDAVAALREMARVLRPGGALAVAVWDALERTPGYAAMTGLLSRLFGDEVARALEAPFGLGDPQRFGALFAEAGLTPVELVTRRGRARFESLERWILTDIRGWTLADALDDEQVERLLAEARNDLARFVGADGGVEFASPAHLAAWRRPAG